MDNETQNLKLKIGKKFEASASGNYALTVLLIAVVGCVACFIVII